MPEEIKKSVEETTVPPISVEEEKKPIAPAEEVPALKTIVEDEQVTLSAKEVETLRKKANDFEQSIELKRISKMQTKEGGEVKPDGEVLNQIREEGEKILSQIKSATVETQNQVLKEVYSDFIRDNKWADKDETFNKLSENFDPGASTSKSELLAKLKSVANEKFPVEYSQAIENKIISEHNAKLHNINAGDMGGGSSIPTNQIESKETVTPEQAEIARKCGNDPKEVYTKE